MDFQNEVIFEFPNGSKIYCTAKAAKYLIIGLGLDLNISKDGKVEKSVEK